jgi:hypothetical protein
MSLSKRVTFNEYDEPRVVIVVEGWHDVVRLNEHLLRGQCEFGDLARRIYLSLQRHVGRKRTKQLVDHCTGRVPWS